MATFNPPHTNGVMTLTDDQKSSILSKLQTLQTAFVASDATPVCDTLYLVTLYNTQNVGYEINGDTCDSLIASSQDAQVVQNNVQGV